MAKNLDCVLVIDVESTCWEGAPPAGQVSEIIEVGLSVLEVKSNEIIEQKGFLIKPTASEISPFCTQLTTITSEMIENEGIDLEEMVKILKTDYQSRIRLWVSWGDYDRNQFLRNCEFRKLAYPFGTSHLNLKTFFAIKNRLSHEVGMEKALEMLGLNLAGTHHRGVDDAYNIAKIFQKVLS
jgi:inhibitor of KinA sporulation pathway (predicted exonuclease)